MKKKIHCFSFLFLLISFSSFSQNSGNENFENSKEINFSGFIGRPGGKILGEMKSSKTADVIKNECTFFGGDTLNGFDFEKTSSLLVEQGFKLYFEFRNMMYRAQCDFVKSKYKLLAFPSMPLEVEHKEPPIVLASSCANLDFEDGNFTNWVVSSGYNTNSNGNLTVGGTGTTSVNQSIYTCQDANIISSSYGNDPLGFPGLNPNGGTYCARIGGYHLNTGNVPLGFGCTSRKWSTTYSNGEILEQTFAVTASNALLSFDYAVVLNDGGHPNGQQPYFHVYVKDATTGAVLSTCTQYYVQAVAGGPPAGFVNSGYVNPSDGSVLYYKNWTSNSINLTPYIGQNVNIEFVAAGCTAGGHMAWAYVDVSCGPAEIITNNSLPCPTQTVLLTAPSVVGGTYSWSGTGVNGLTTQTVNITSSGTYTVVVTPSQGASCSYTLTKTITYGTLPTVTTPATGTLTCASTTVNASVSTSASPVSYSWSGTGITSGSSTATISVNQPGTFNFTVTNTANGCKTTGSQTVTQNTLTPSVTSSSTGSLNCLTTTVNVSATTSMTPVSYNWSGTGISSGSGTGTITVTQGGTFNYTVTNTTSGCSTTGLVTVTQNTTLPSPSASTAGTLTCAASNQTVNLNGGPGAGVTYTWTGPGVSSGVNSQNATANAPGTYTLTITDNVNKCSKTATTSVTQNTVAPSVTPAASGTLNCSVNLINVSATTTVSPASYTWTGTGITSGAGTGTISVNQPGTFSYTVLNSSNGCNTTGTQVVSQNTVVPTVTVSPTQTITCAVPTVTITGASTPSTATPVWSGGVSGGSNSFTATASAANNYTLTVTNPANGCSGSSVVQVVPDLGFPDLSVPAITNSITCSLNTASVVVSTTSTPVSYAWSGTGITSGTTTNSISVNTGGTYTLVVRNTSSGCTSTVTAFVPTNTTIPSPTASNTGTLTCAVNSQTVSLNGNALSNTTYTWSGPSVSSGTNNQIAVANAPGTYTLAVTNTVNSCTNTATTTVVQNTLTPSVLATPSGSLNCITSTVNVVASTTMTPVSHTWTGTGITSVSNSSTITVNQGGTFTYTVTNTSNSCVTINTVAVIQNTTAPSVTGANTGSLNCTVLSINASATTTTTPVSYNWSGTGITSATNISTITVNQGGTFTYTVTNTANNCTTTNTVAVIQNTTAPTVTGANTGSLNCAVLSINASATTTTTPVSYNWSGTGITSATNISTITVNQGGTFTYTVTNTANNCKTTNTVAVIQNTTAPSVTGANTGSLNCQVFAVNVSATTTTTPVSYNWSGPSISSGNGTDIISVDVGGTYSYTVTNTDNNCKTTNTVAVIQNTIDPTASALPTGSINCNTSSVTIVASSTTTPVSFDWSGPGVVSGANTPTLTVNAGGTYTYNVTNTANYCLITNTVAVIQNTTSPSVTGANTGSLNCTVLSVNASATTTTTPVSYNWSGTGITSATNISTITVNQGGTYTYTVTNTANNCTTTNTVAVIQNTTAPSVTGANTGSLNCTVLSVNASATTSTTPVSYNWSGTGITSATNISTITVNQGGTYTYTVTNTTNNCITTNTVAVIQSTTAPSVTGANTGSLNCTVLSVNASATTSTTPVSYNWSGSGITSATNISTITVNQGGTFTYTVTNTANNCSTTNTVAVIQNTTVPSVTGANTGSLNCTVLSVNASATTSTTPVSCNWSGSGITSATNISTITVNQPGTYNYTVTNTFNNCSTTNTIAIIQNTIAPSVTMPGTQTITCATPTVSLVGSANPSTCTPVWTGGVSSGANSYTATASSATIYTLTVTNPFNNCTNSGTVQVSPSAGFPSVTSSMSNSITCSMTSAQVVASTTTTPVSYSWTGPGSITGASASTATVNAGGTYTCVVTNTLSACSSTTTVFVPTNTTAVAASIAPTSSINCLVTTQVLNASPTGSYSYSWTPNAGLTGTSIATPTVSTGGTYSVVITNTINGCVGSASIAVVSNTVIPTVTISPSSFTITCATPTVQLTANTSTNTLSYNWSSPATGTLTSTSVSNPVASGAGVFTVVVTNTVNGCVSLESTSSITLDVVIPTATLSANSLSITCTTPTPSTSVSTSTSAVSYSWSPSTGIASGATTANPTFTAAGTYSAVVTNTINGCSSNSSANMVTVILDNTIPTITITPSQTLTCTTPTITVSTTVNPSTGVNYDWNGTGVTGLTTSSVDVNQPGVYTTTVTNPVNGCSVTANVSISSNTIAPVANIAVNSITTTCAAPTATLNVTSTPSTGVSYNWNAPGSGSLNTYTISNPVAGGSGIFTVTVTDNTNGCSTAVSQATVEIIPDAATPVVNVSANSLTITCTNTTVTTALTSTNSIASYNWNPSPVSGGANPVFDTPGVYTATVTATNGCPTNVSVNVGIDMTVPTMTLTSATNDGTLTCLTTSITITPTVSPSANLTYTWSPSTGLASNANQASATFTAAGVYTLVVTNTITGCVSSSTNAANSFSVTEDNLAPTFTLGTAPSVTTTCAAPNATLSGTSNADPNSIYTWTTPTSATVVGNPIVNSNPGTYSVVVTNTINGCSTSATSPATVEVVADAGIPNITLSANSVSITCSNPTPSVAITTTASPVTYSWSPASGIVPGTETTANPTFTAPGSYSVVVTNSASGCATTLGSNVVDVTLDNAIPSVTLSTVGNTGTITCVNPSVPISPIVTSTANLTYTWLPSGVTSTSINDATFTTAGVYTLVVTNTLTGCVNTTTNSTNTFTVYENIITPTVNVTATSGNTVIGCSNPIVSFSANVNANSTNLTYTWNPGGANTSTVDINTAGIYDVTVMDAVNGCTASTQFTVDGNTIPPQGVNAGTNVSIACGSSTIQLSGTAPTSSVSYTWSGPSATSVITESNTLSPTVGEVGIYTLTVTDNLTGCQSTSTVSVSQTNVTAAFTADPTSGISPLLVNFTDASTGATSWSWNFGDSNTSNQQNPGNTFSTGSYTVTLTASSGSCTSTATLVITVEDGLTIEIPNVFTPNGDGANDIFSIKSTGVKEISLQIFNRWGEKLYEFSGPKAAWDGLAPNGSKVPDGTYYYFVKAIGFDSTEIEKQGTLNLFR